MLDGFIDLSGFFDEFIKKNPVFSKSQNVQFLIFNPDFTSIEYVHNSTASLAIKEDFEAFKKLTSESKIKEKSKEELEIIRLNKELAHLKLEHEILKKAVSIFSRSDR